MVSSYHEVLGISHDASLEEIKRAYHKKVRRLHPNVTGPGHEDEFEEASSAYEVLSGAGKRQMYDLGRGGAVRSDGGLGGRFAGTNFGDLGGIFQPFFDGGTVSHGPVSRTRRGQNALIAADMKLFDVVFGVTRSAPIDAYVAYTAYDGSCCAPGTKPVAYSQCNGVDNVQRMTHTLLGQVMILSSRPGCQGYGIIIVIPYKDRSGEGRIRVRQDLRISVPAGASARARTRMSGCGEAGPAGGPNGDLYLEIHEKLYGLLERDSGDLCTKLRVPMTVVALGAVFPLQTLDGEQNVTVKTGSQPGDEIVLDGLGTGRLRRKGRGDPHVSIVMETPTRPNDRQRGLPTELARLRREDDVELVHDSSVMDKLKERFSKC